MQRKLMGVFMFLSVCAPCVRPSQPFAQSAEIQALTEKIPTKSATAMTGSQFAQFISTMNPHQREQAVLNAILAGDIPNFLRKLVPVKLEAEADGRSMTATIFVMPEYLAIGSNDDFLRIPMNLETATAVAVRFGFILPTKKIVNAIYSQSRFHFTPHPMMPGAQMRSTEYYWTHNRFIEQEAQSNGVPLGALVSGDKKDIVMTNLLRKQPGRIAIYGWHRLTGVPIQPISTVHGACYEDYSHGVRLISNVALVDGRLRPVAEMLRDPVFANVLSDEGPIDISAFQPYVNASPCWRESPTTVPAYSMVFAQRNPK